MAASSHVARRPRIGESPGSQAEQPDPVMTPTAPQQLHFPAGGVDLAGEADGSGPTIVLLHGLTATRR